FRHALVQHCTSHAPLLTRSIRSIGLCIGGTLCGSVVRSPLSNARTIVGGSPFVSGPSRQTSLNRFDAMSQLKVIKQNSKITCDLVARRPLEFQKRDSIGRLCRIDCDHVPYISLARLQEKRGRTKAWGALLVCVRRQRSYRNAPMPRTSA